MRIRDLRSLRIEKGLSVHQLAQLAGTTAATISRIENFTSEVRTCRSHGGSAWRTCGSGFPEIR